MATAYAVNSRLLRGFCASGPKSIAHKRSFGKSPAPAEGRFPGVFSRSGQGRAARHGRGLKIRTFAADSGQQAKAVPRQAQPGGHPGQDGRPSGRRYGGRDLHRRSRHTGPTPVIPTEKRIRPAHVCGPRPAPSARGRLPAPGRQATVRPCVQKSPASARINWSSCRAWPKAVNRPAVSSWPARWRSPPKDCPPAPRPKRWTSPGIPIPTARSSSCWGRSASSVAAPTSC